MLIKLQMKLTRFYVKEAIKYNIKKLPSYKGSTEVQTGLLLWFELGAYFVCDVYFIKWYCNIL